MTDEEAKLGAHRRWGGIAYVRDRRAHSPLVPRYVVGVISHKAHKNVLVHGEGSTWEDAFNDADARAEFLRPYMQDLRSVD